MTPSRDDGVVFVVRHADVGVLSPSGSISRLPHVGAEGFTGERLDEPADDVPTRVLAVAGVVTEAPSGWWRDAADDVAALGCGRDVHRDAHQRVQPRGVGQHVTQRRSASRPIACRGAVRRGVRRG